MELDTGFRPSRHGFGYANTWRDTFFGVVESRGRCGGMVFAALDAFAAGVELPGAGPAELPAHDSAEARAILGRQFDSVVAGFGGNLLEFARYTYVPRTSRFGIGVATRRELLPLFDALRAGWPVPLGLVAGTTLKELVRNHQVLAYAADFGESHVTVRVYDPNHPRRDDITLEVSLDPAELVIERIGRGTHRWRGFFVERYSPASPTASNS